MRTGHDRKLLCCDLSTATVYLGQSYSVVSCSTEDGNINNFENVVVLISPDNGKIKKNYKNK
jgi:hypothetical protein